MSSKLIIILLPLITCAVSQLIVSLPNGQIRGHELKTFTNKTYNAYQSIPFASPPVGELRFQPPEPAKNWSDILDATQESNICFQLTTNSDDESEDCLYLNVFTPVLNAEKNNTKLPVVFWIFSGGLRDGAARFRYTSPEYWMDEEVILVTFNYRVGIFGFLSTGDSVIPGNYGLKDQVLALKWTNENIHLFGGDIEKITIYGVSAGAVSVGYHLLIKQSAGLFRAAIAESGSPLNTYSFLPQPERYALQLTQAINPNISSNATSEEIRNFLMTLDGRTIDNFSRSPTISQPGVAIEPESPTAVVTKEMYEMFAAGDFYKVPMLMGINSEESIYIATSTGALVKRGRTYDADPSLVLPDIFPYDSAGDKNTIGEAIKLIYMNESDTWAERTGRVVRHFSDQRFTRANIMAGKLISKYVPVYFYQFSYDGDLGGWSIVVEDADRVQHGEECKYIFLEQPVELVSESDGLTHKRLLRMWIDFIKYLNPTPEPNMILQNITWPVATPTDYKYLNINESLSIEKCNKYFINLRI